MKKHSLIALFALAALAGCQEEPSETQTLQPAVEEAPAVEDPVHTSRVSLDWNGMYRGMVPCSDCAGTNLLLELKAVGTYSLSRSYVDKMSATVMEEGPIVWTDSHNTIQVGEYRFFVGENQLSLVGEDGVQLIDSEGQQYTLTKE